MSDRSANKRLISCDCPRQAISKSMRAVEASSFPSVFKEGWLRLNKNVPFLSGADGVVSKRSRSLLINIRGSAPYFCLNLLTTPSAPLRNGLFLFLAQPPLLENGGEWTRLATNPASQPVGQF